MDSDDWIAVLVSLLVLFVIIAISYALNSIKCNSIADTMNMRSRFGVTTGCMIEHKPGVWIPLSSFRAL